MRNHPFRLTLFQIYVVLLLFLPGCNSKKENHTTRPLNSESTIPVAKKNNNTPSFTQANDGTSSDQLIDDDPEETIVIGKCDLAVLKRRGVVAGDSVMRILPAIENCTDCRDLELSHSLISEIPPEVCNMSQLQTIDLSHNDITALPPEIGRMTQLQSINLSHNDIAALPPEIGKMTKLQSLDLSNNDLSSLPPEITRLYAIRKVNVDSNDLHPEDLSEDVLEWLNRKDPDWRGRQKNLEMEGFGDHFDLSGYQRLAPDVRDTIPVILKMDSSSLLFEPDRGQPAGHYFALRWKDSTSFLDSVLLTEKKDSVILPGCSIKYFARILSYNHEPDILLLVRGIGSLKPGPVKTWYVNKEWAEKINTDDDDSYNTAEDIKLNLELPEPGNFSLEGIPFGGCPSSICIQYRVRFGDGPWLQLPIIGDNFEGPPLPEGKDCVLWIGDLDGDNEPDMLLDPAEEDYGAVFIQLYLSSRNKSGRTWKPTASFNYLIMGIGGC